MEHRSVSPVSLSSLFPFKAMSIPCSNSPNFFPSPPPPPLHQHSGQIHALCWLSFPNDIRWAAVGSSANRCPIEGYV
ncbi:hypothetical protein AAG906_018800 [Vitis piasezkii]